MAERCHEVTGEGKKAAFTLAEVLITIGIIGVVAALTIPTLMTNYKKHLIETRLKHSYALLTQAERMAEAEHGDPSGWDYLSDDFIATYIIPYIKGEIRSKDITNLIGGRYKYHPPIFFNNGTEWIIRTESNGSASTNNLRYSAMIIVDINGTQMPNEQGKDRFTFYIFSDKAGHYNTGSGDCAKNVPSAGVYYDGYGFDDSSLLNAEWRGCGGSTHGSNGDNAYCVALIIKNNWKIPADYPLKL